MKTRCGRSLNELPTYLRVPEDGDFTRSTHLKSVHFTSIHDANLAHPQDLMMIDIIHHFC